MASGRIIRFNQVNGYGFIEPDDGGEDVFVHTNDVLDPDQILRVGMRVKYSAERGSRGWRAYDVEVIPSPRSAPSPAVPAATAPQPSAAAPAGPAAQPAQPAKPAEPAETDDGLLIDVVSTAEYEREITEALLDTIGSVTAAEILEVRRRLVKTASNRGWLE
jgi:CspA family cold shock protein